MPSYKNNYKYSEQIPAPPPKYPPDPVADIWFGIMEKRNRKQEEIGGNMVSCGINSTNLSSHHKRYRMQKVTITDTAQMHYIACYRFGFIV